MTDLRDGSGPGTVRTLYDGALLPDTLVRTLRRVDRLLPCRRVAHGERVQPLPASPRPLAGLRFQSTGKPFDPVDYLALNRVSGLLVLKDGAVALEQYALGNTAASRWTSMSMVKSISTTLVGAAIHDGFIGHVDQPVTQYLPALAGSAYDGVSIRHLLQMSSGVQWNETYTDPNSDRRHMLDMQIAQRPGAIVELMSRLPRAAAPGSRWNYSTGETHLVGALLRAAVGMPLAKYLSERIWAPFGMEADALWWLESRGGLEVGGSGFSARLRDFARFGLFMLADGVAQGKRVLPEGWVHEATVGSTVRAQNLQGQELPYGYMWWGFPAEAGVVHEGAYHAIGIFGQYLYVHPRQRIVIAVTSALPKPRGMVPVPHEDFFGAVVRSLGD